MPKDGHRAGRLSQRVSMSDLEILFSVAGHGSMARAAQELGISQPAISRAMAELEASLGVRLLDRTRRGVVPTRYGIAMAKRANTVLDELKQGLKEIEFLSDPTVGELVVGAPELLIEALLPDVVQKFWSDFPRVLINIVPTLAGDFVNLRSRTIDFQINRLKPDFFADDIAFEPLFDERIFVVAGTTSPWARRQKVKLADLLAERWVVQNNTSDNVAYVFQAEQLPVPRATVAAGSAYLRNRLAASGDFLAIIVAPQLYVLRNQGLKVKVLPVDLSAHTIKVASFFLKHRTLSPVSKLFLRSVREICSKGKFAAAM